MDAQRAPITLPVANRLVYSPHVYGPDVSSQPYFSASNYPDNMPNIWDLHFGFVNKKYGPLVIGEWGGKFLSTGDIKWQDKFASYLKQNSIGFFYWSLNPNSGDTQDLFITLDVASLHHQAANLFSKESEHYPPAFVLLLSITRG
ncbi:hypothetical protein AC1031_010937 [Aphanomyces cochlioides]|nr:hypothetical protein AC1031_010937 [Aphanomyces cochlioides]